LKNPIIQKLSSQKIITTAKKFSLSGKLTISQNKLVYLDIDDAYIHSLFPLLANPLINKPQYFNVGGGGAHISVIYPEENKIINKTDLSQQHDFVIKELVTAEIGLKTYYVILVDAPSLLLLRRKYNLTDMLCFKGYAINFHITLGVLTNSKSN
jgi:hypothetical protein